MRNEEFEELTRRRFDHCARVMNHKNEEYARNCDKLHNFKVAARFSGGEPEDALWGMMLKHLVSVKDIIDDLTFKKIPPQHVLNEKVTDIINYTVLLEALITERYGTTSFDIIGKKSE